jgi:phosphinothricin acetyltransferase
MQQLGSMVIRPATEEDLNAVLGIYNAAIENTTAVFEYRPHSIDARREWFANKRAGGWPVIVAVDRDVVIGFASYGPFRGWPAYKYSVEHSVYVAESSRRQGVGEALLRAVVDDARARGFHTMIGGVTSDNTASLKLHRKVGFVDAGAVRQSGYKFGRWLDLVFVQIVFDTPSDPKDG